MHSSNLPNLKPTKIASELFPELLGISGMNPFVNTCSSSRVQMFGSHIGQTYVMKKPDTKSIITGVELEMSKYTVCIKMPENGKVLKIIDRYPQGFQGAGFKFNPERVVIYQNEDGVIGILRINTYSQNHPYFGFDYKSTDAAHQLREGTYLQKDTVLYDSPNKTAKGHYTYGKELKMAYCSLPYVAEDGIAICDDVLDDLSMTYYESRVVSWGKNHVPLNLYGDDKNYKIFPDIGEPINENYDGLLMALREVDPTTTIVDQSVKAMQVVDHYFDKCTYADGRGGEVVDIIVHCNPPNKGDVDCDEVSAQALKYHRANLQFRTNIIQFIERLQKQNGGYVPLTPELHRFMVESYAVVNNNMEGKRGKNINMVYKLNEMDHFHVEFVVRYRRQPNFGGKLTDISGGKGVITAILPRDQMPGGCDICMAQESNINRMKFSSLYEQYLNCAKDSLRNEFLSVLGCLEPSMLPNMVAQIKPEQWEYMIQRIGRYHEIVSPQQHEWFQSWSDADRKKYIVDGLVDKFYDYFPVNNPIELTEMVEILDKEFNVRYERISYKTPKGRLVTTLDPIRIGPVYIIALEKIGGEFSSVSVAQTQANGVVSFTKGTDKHNKPTKEMPVRAMGESETRLMISCLGGEHASEIHERTNSLVRRKRIAWDILDAENPAKIPSLYHPDVPRGHSQPLQLVKHFLACAGIGLVYKPFDAVAARIDGQTNANPNDIIDGMDDDDEQTDDEE